MEQTDPVPGLGRGLALLAHLNREGACSLERLAGDLSYPKSSTSRLLESLVLAGCIVRDPESKRFRAVRALVDLTAAQDRDLRALLANEPAGLAAQSGSSVEVYAWADQNLVMIDRADPEDREVVVWARVGWVRPPDEVDCLNQLAIAFGGRAPDAAGWRWATPSPSRAHVDRVNVPVETALRLAKQAAQHGFAHDGTGNGRGVLRVAAPLLADGKLLGVLALAGPSSHPPSEAAIAALCGTARRFADRFSPVPSTGVRS